MREEPLRQPDSSLTPYHPYPSPLLGRLRCVYLNLNTRAAAILLTANDTGSLPAGHSVRRSTGRATQLKWPQMLWRGSLAPSTCSTSFQDHAHRTPGEWRDSYGIPSRRRSNNGLIKCQGVVRDTVRVSISFMLIKGVGLYFFYIACVTLHPLPCLQLFIAELLPYELIRVSWCIVSLSICTTPLLSVKRSNFKAWPNKGRRKTILI